MTDIAGAAEIGLASVDDIRARFPALERREGGHPVAYFDGPGGTQVPLEVVDAMRDYLLHHNANTRWAYPTSAETDAAIDGARRALADFLGAGADEVVFGANMTTLTFHLARALGRTFQAGDRVVVTELDHHANIDPWRDMAEERRLDLAVVRMDPQTGTLDEVDLERKLAGERVRLLAIGAASNAIGTAPDVRRATSLAHAAGALVFLDAVHAAAHERIDVRALGCDFLACSPYKFYGPHSGALFGRRELLATLPVPKVKPAPTRAPERVETGTRSHEALVGAAAAVDFLASLAPGADRLACLDAAFRGLHARSEALFTRLWEGLVGIRGVRLFGPPPGGRRTPTVGFVVDGCAPREVARRLAERGVFVSHGDFYASTVIERLGQTGGGLVRAGCAAYTTAEEVDRLVEGVRAVAGD